MMLAVARVAVADPAVAVAAPAQPANVAVVVVRLTRVTLTQRVSAAVSP